MMSNAQYVIKQLWKLALLQKNRKCVDLLAPYTVEIAFFLFVNSQKSSCLFPQLRRKIKQKINFKLRIPPIQVTVFTAQLFQSQVLTPSHNASDVIKQFLWV